jgi:hypothetical protein
MDYQCRRKWFKLLGLCNSVSIGARLSMQPDSRETSELLALPAPENSRNGRQTALKMHNAIHSDDFVSICSPK